MANQPTYEVTFLSDASMQSRVFNDSLKNGIDQMFVWLQSINYLNLYL